MVTTPPSDSVTLTINGHSVTAPKGTLLVEAAKQVGVEIPIFCYHPKLKPVGACRMCLVQIEKLPRLQTACTTPVAVDMIVHTNTPDVIAAQNGVIELLLANHPLDCPICDKGGECPLQDNTFGFGLGVSRFTEEKRHKEKAYPLGERIVLDRERCIMCYRCVRFHQEIPGDESLAAVQRGPETEIATLSGEPYDSMFSGNTIELCPVGALTSRQYRFKARPWDLVRTESVCNGCSVGCNIEVHSRTETVLRLVSRENPSIDDGWLCDRGRFDTVPLPHSARPPRPLVRSGSASRSGFAPAGSGAAAASGSGFASAAPGAAAASGAALSPASWEDAVRRAAELLGSDGAVLASAGLSNEAFWILEQLHGKLRGALWPLDGAAQWPVQGEIANLATCKRILLIGLDAWNELPVLALWIRRAVVAGAKLVVVGTDNGLWRNTTHWLRTEPTAELVSSLADALRGTVPSPSTAAHAAPAAASEPADLPAAAAAPADLLAAAAALRSSEPGALLVHPRLVGALGVDALTALAETLGIDPVTGLRGAPLLGANGRGAQEFAPSVAAADPEQIASASALLVLGDEPWPATAARAARIILATTGSIPEDDARIDVVLPLAHPYERQASITNLEGRVQLQEGGAAPPPRARADWSLLAALASAFGISVPDDLEQLRAAMAEQHPTHRDALVSERLIARV